MRKLQKKTLKLAQVGSLALRSHNHSIKGQKREAASADVEVAASYPIDLAKATNVATLKKQFLV